MKNGAMPVLSGLVICASSSQFKSAVPAPPGRRYPRRCELALLQDRHPQPTHGRQPFPQSLHFPNLSVDALGPVGRELCLVSTLGTRLCGSFDSSAPISYGDGPIFPAQDHERDAPQDRRGVAAVAQLGPLLSRSVPGHSKASAQAARLLRRATSVIVGSSGHGLELVTKNEGVTCSRSMKWRSPCL